MRLLLRDGVSCVEFRALLSTIRRVGRSTFRPFSGGSMISEQAFTGVKVLAVARVVAAPFAAYQLAMHGADVIHIENPSEGDSARTSGNLDTPFHRAEMAYNFLAYNANKRSMTLAINTPAGQEVFRRMAGS